MDLHTFFKNLRGEDAKAKFAESCGTSLGHMRNVVGKHASCSPALAVAIERESGRAVMRWDLRPDDWQAIWPELIARHAAAVAKAARKKNPRRAAVEA